MNFGRKDQLVIAKKIYQFKKKNISKTVCENSKKFFLQF